MQQEVTIKPAIAYLYSLGIFTASVILFGGAFAWQWGLGQVGREFNKFLLSYDGILTLVGGTILHEALHGFTWAAFASKGVKSIRYGVQWASMSPYAHCSEPLPICAYRLGGMMPGIVIGILPAIVSIVLGSGWLLMTGIFFTAGAAGDFMILWKLLPYKSNTMIQDHPKEMGFIVSDDN